MDNLKVFPTNAQKNVTPEQILLKAYQQSAELKSCVVIAINKEGHIMFACSDMSILEISGLLEMSKLSVLLGEDSSE